MWNWRKKHDEEERSWRSAARAALSGAPREEVVREAIHSLAKDGRADRIGIWLEQDSPAGHGSQAMATLRGVLWELHGEETPIDWEKLSLEPPLPHDLLASGQSVEQSLDSSQAKPLIGPLVGLHQILWTPIRGKGHLRGVILTGTQRKQAPLPRELAESVAAELALALEFEEEQRQARERQLDLRVSKQILATLSNGASTDTILSRVVASCTEASTDGSGPAASFAIIGHKPAPSSGTASDEMEFAWESGDSAWTRAVEREPLASLWRQALEAGHVVGVEPPSFWSTAGLTRLVAIPLLLGGEPLGVFVAGISQNSSSLDALERLELRASLAVSALERRRAQAEKIRRLARRAALLESSPEATILLDSNGAIVGLNRAAKTLLGDSRSSQLQDIQRQDVQEHSIADPGWCIGGRLSQLFCAREQARVEDWSRRVLAAEREKGLEPREVCEAELINGARARLHDPVSAGDDLAAIVLGPVVTQEGALQRTRAEAELHNVLEWLEEGILLFGANNTIRAMNTRFAQIAGISAEEAAACATMDGLIALLTERAAEPERFAKRWRELARAAEGGTREEVQLARPVPRVLERSVRPVLDAMGRRLGRVEIYRDLSAQRVFQARLLQTEKLAALGQMVTGVAHELSSPLTSILGYAQRLLVRNDLAGRTEEARQIYQEAERASTILRQLLLTARESHPERKRVSLNQVVLRSMELQRFGSAAEKIRIELDLDPALPFVMGDAGKLQQVLMNLIGNARQAIVQEGKPGTIQLRTARSADGRVLLEVIDDGPGIPQSILGRIFDPFFTTKPPDIGTGLGLAIVLSVVREHGGQMNVTSPPGGGARFTVELPAAAESTAEPVPRSVTRKKTSHAMLTTIPQKNRLHERPTPPRANHKGTRVLVLEDEPTVARLIADVLEDDGLHVDVLLDGREALDRTEREPYDLVICDMKMPGLDGQHFYQSLAGARNPLQHRFLFVTGDVMAAQTQEFLERNSLPHVAKPFRVEELTEKVFGLLDSQLARRTQAAAAKKAH